MCGQRAWGWLHLAVVVPKHGLACLSGLLEVVVGNGREEVVDDMCANIVVHLVEDAVIPVQCGEPASQVAPLLTSAWLAQLVSFIY